MSQTDARAAFLRSIAECAIAAEKATGFPAQVTIAQACLESAYGARATGDYNYFGLTKAIAPNQPQKLVRTHERLTLAGIEQLPADERATIASRTPIAGSDLFDVQLSRNFPSFSSLQDAVNCYVHLLTTGHRYSAAWQHWQSAKDVGALIDGIAKAGYATSGGYATLVRQIAEGPRVAGAITDARTA